MNIEHDEPEGRFFVRFDDGDAELAYTRVGPKVIDIQHTYVPTGARGHGVAEALAGAAFEYARENGLRVVPTCPFVRKWLEAHPEEVKIVDPRYAKPLEHRPRA